MSQNYMSAWPVVEAEITVFRRGFKRRPQRTTPDADDLSSLLRKKPRLVIEDPAPAPSAESYLTPVQQKLYWLTRLEEESPDDVLLRVARFCPADIVTLSPRTRALWLRYRTFIRPLSLSGLLRNLSESPALRSIDGGRVARKNCIQLMGQVVTHHNLSKLPLESLCLRDLCATDHLVSLLRRCSHLRHLDLRDSPIHSFPRTTELLKRAVVEGKLTRLGYDGAQGDASNLTFGSGFTNNDLTELRLSCACVTATIDSVVGPQVHTLSLTQSLLLTDMTDGLSLPALRRLEATAIEVLPRLESFFKACPNLLELRWNASKGVLSAMEMEAREQIVTRLFFTEDNEPRFPDLTFLALRNEPGVTADVLMQIILRYRKLHSLYLEGLSSLSGDIVSSCVTPLEETESVAPTDQTAATESPAPTHQTGLTVRFVHCAGVSACAFADCLQGVRGLRPCRLGMVALAAWPSVVRELRHPVFCV